MTLAATQMKLEIVSYQMNCQKEKITYDITYVWNLKYGTNELIYKTETYPQT